MGTVRGKTKNRMVLYAASALAAIWLLLSALMSTAFNDEIYYIFQDICGVDAETSHVSDEERVIMNRELAMYLASEGELSDAFNATERMHMADVRALFKTLQSVMLICFALAICLTVYAFLRARERIVKRFIIGFGAFAGALLVAAICLAIDFSGAFTLFHELAFDNMLWSLDPVTDKMIRILPENWFAYMGLTVLARALLRMALFVVALRLVLYMTNRKAEDI